MNKIALVTGASSGIGEAIARELIKRGYTVIGIARSLDKLDELQKELGSFIPFPCDVANKSSIALTSSAIQALNLCPTLFFLNAGAAGASIIENPDRFDIAMHERVMQVNYFGVLSWVECWENQCKKNDGAKFIVTSSQNAIFAPPTGSAYSASKAAIAKAFESLTLTYHNTNLQFAVVYCGPVATAGMKSDVKLPFVWTPTEMGTHMVDFAFSNKTSTEPAFFYKIIARILRALPPKYTIKLLRRNHK